MVTLVTTKGKGSMDVYSQKLSENLSVSKLYTDIYQKNAELFNISLFCPEAVKAIWGDWHFVRMLNRQDCVLHLPNHHLGRYGYFLKIPFIITVHDLIRYFDGKGYGPFIHRPNFRDKLYLSLDYRGIKKATRIIAVSQTTKRDLIKHLRIPEECISVVHEGIDHQLFQPTSRRMVDYPYILFVGSEHPRKNFARVLQAFKQLKGEARFKDLKLLKVGKPGGPEADFRKETQQAIAQLELSDDVVFTGHVPNEDLPAYYSGAGCFILPSLYEGFGFPPLEAMACGCAVIISNVAALPEISGEAALKVDPYDIDGMLNTLRQVLTDGNLKQELISKGLRRAGQFSWEKTAEETLEVYNSVERCLSPAYVPAEIGGSVEMPKANSPTKAVILVGGMGTRLRPLTSTLPKPMMPVLNRPFLEHTIAYLKQNGIKETILAIGYLPDVIRDYFGDGSNLGTRLIYAVETNPLGTAGAVKNAEQHLDTTFAVLNGDVFTDLDLGDMLAFHRRKKAKATIALTWVDNPSAFGVVETDVQGRVKRFVEKPPPDQATSHWINAGTYILEPEVLQHVPPAQHYMFEKGLFPLLLELGKPVYGYHFKGYWLDMGTLQKYLQLNCDLLLSKTKSALVSSLKRDEVRFDKDVIVHPTAKILGPALIGSRTRISQGAYIKGPAVIGQDCHIGEGASIETAILWDSVDVCSGAILKQCIVSNNSRVEDNCRVTNSVLTPEHTETVDVTLSELNDDRSSLQGERR